MLKFLASLITALLLVFSVFGQDQDYADRKSYLTKVSISEADKLKVFNETWQTVNRLYFDPTFNGHDWSKLREQYQPQAVAAKDTMELMGVLGKMLSELKTSHLGISFQIGISGGTLKKFFGSDVNYKLNDIPYDYGYITGKFGESNVVIQVDETSSAAEAGLKPGWIVKSCENKTQLKEFGESFVHTETADCVFTDEINQPRPLTLSKSFYLKPRAVTLRQSQLLPDNILYLKFSEFDRGTGKWLKNSIADNPSAQSVIIDLRDNMGGYLDEVDSALAGFFPPKTVVGVSIERDADRRPHSVGSADRYQGQVVVLLNERSYSGAEIFAAAIQEAGRGKIIGQKSQGSVLEGIRKGLPNNLKLYVAIRDYQTAKGVRLEGTGVTPDIIVDSTIEDFRQKNDLTLKKALETLKN